MREAARLQSFHDGFVFRSSEWQMLKQVGNAVPPLLGRAAGLMMRELIGARSASVVPIKSADTSVLEEDKAPAGKPKRKAA